MTDFMTIQRKRIEIDKWLEGCRINGDPGADYILEWIENHAAEFREAWERSFPACR